MVEHISRLNPDDRAYAFGTGLLARLLLSAVIEGDRADTAAFMSGRTAPDRPTDMTPIWQGRLAYLEEKLKEFPCGTPVEKARRAISEQCRGFAAREPGIYRLNVPTGGGKTLASLRYALAHAMIYNRRRLFFASPLLSILEQNASVIRRFVGDDDLILEHHSNVVQTELHGEELDRRELLVQSWDAPIVVTTLVQLLNTMFDGKTTSVRRFWALCGSVIVIDEYEIIGLNLKSQLNQGFRGLVLFLLTLKIADTAIHRRQYAQNRNLSAERGAASLCSASTRHTLPTYISFRRPTELSACLDLHRLPLRHSTHVPVARAA